MQPEAEAEPSSGHCDSEALFFCSMIFSFESDFFPFYRTDFLLIQKNNVWNIKKHKRQVKSFMKWKQGLVYWPEGPPTSIVVKS